MLTLTALNVIFVQSRMLHVPELHMGKGKGKVHPRTGHEGPEGEKRYSSTVSLNPALDGPHGRSGWVQKILPPLGFNSRTVQPKPSRYTD